MPIGVSVLQRPFQRSKKGFIGWALAQLMIGHACTSPTKILLDELKMAKNPSSVSTSALPVFEITDHLKYRVGCLSAFQAVPF